MAGMLREATGTLRPYTPGRCTETSELDSMPTEAHGVGLPMTLAATMPSPPVRAEPNPFFL